MVKDGQCKKVCDYLLVATVDGLGYACFIELKRTLTDETDAREQLRRSLPMLKYLRTVCEIECETTYDRTALTIQYSLIATRQSLRIDKRRVREGPNSWPAVESYKDITVRKFVGSRIAFAQLIST